MASWLDPLACCNNVPNAIEINESSDDASESDLTCNFCGTWLKQSQYISCRWCFHTYCDRYCRRNDKANHVEECLALKNYICEREQKRFLKKRKALITEEQMAFKRGKLLTFEEGEGIFESKYSGFYILRNMQKEAEHSAFKNRAPESFYEEHHFDDE